MFLLVVTIPWEHETMEMDKCRIHIHSRSSRGKSSSITNSLRLKRHVQRGFPKKYSKRYTTMSTYVTVEKGWWLFNLIWFTWSPSWDPASWCNMNNQSFDHSPRSVPYQFPGETNHHWSVLQHVAEQKGSHWHENSWSPVDRRPGRLEPL